VARVLCHFETVHREKTVHRAVGEGQSVIVNEHAVQIALRRPAHRTQTIRHEYAEALHLASKPAKEGCGIA